MTLEFTQGQLGDMFNDWLYSNYQIGNGDQLIQQMENPDNWDSFLADSGLPAELEMEF